jgi:hypothetical protein
MDTLKPLLDNQDVIAQVSMAIGLIYGLLIFLAPHKTRDIFNIKALELKDPKGWEVCDYIRQRCALCMLTPPVVWWLHVEAGLSRDEAIGVALLPWILLCLHSLLNIFTLFSMRSLSNSVPCQELIIRALPCSAL